ncbi:phosphoglycolate phosphatase [Lutimaribacter sp. EGI FJ00015]|uniref:Phosphoglycolate phosphatase n=1 Tax=Lutimaribacter degradans TaxID=2945989 RepID=A0ACC5ZU16_9RHOB|nr:phosphoglycolate phosphatase [Lutimaribacter sp. EGI FJ00013]MCM2560879.1 phosphoglycolate phosphatase [Lutimaribacter sp. EGI FJ00013]MCO0612176.1 phosphoglycolate phosphatase [Lutimaribacter sp. EGI FJ00015]MCO0634704.1 phosphoglycolate phosphatase [Lutimaribacter sp. EGI FJ00014]
MKAVVFDLDGTLIDSLPGIANAANTLLQEEGRPTLPQGDIAGFVGLGEIVFLKRLIAAGGLDPARFDRLMERFILHYKNAAQMTGAFPGAREALCQLRADGWTIGLCTNKPTGPLRAVLDHLELDGAFDTIVAGDTLDRRKPDPAPLRHTLDGLGAATGIFVGDSPVDAETARAANVPFVLFTGGIRTVALDEMPHDKAFDDFSQLPAICRALI